MAVWKHSLVILFNGRYIAAPNETNRLIRISCSSKTESPSIGTA